MATKASISIYRKLIRTVQKTFAGDPPAIFSARTELRKAFLANRNLSDQSKINEKMAEAVEANEFLRENVIQAVKKDCGSYEISPEKAQQLRSMDPEHLRPNMRG